MTWRHVRATWRYLWPAAIVAAEPWMALPVMAAPLTPSSDGVVLEHVVPSADPAESEVRTLTASLRQDPANRALAVRVARLNVARGQSLADARYFGRAGAALSPWIGDRDPPADVRLLRAILLQFHHRFDAAEDDLGHVLAVEPGNAQARLTRATIRQVRANYAGARDDCAHLIGVAPGAALDTCVASVAAITGYARPSLVKLTMAANDPSAPPTVRLWALTLKGEVAARLGNNEIAIAAFEQASALAPNDVYLLAAYADTLMNAGRADAVVALLAERTRADVLLLCLTEAEQRLGRPNPQHVSELAARFETSRRRGEMSHQREEARFTLHILRDPAKALRLAQDNWSSQREVADARILLEAAIAANMPDAAVPVLAWLSDNNVEDTRLAHIAASVPPGTKAASR